MKVLLTVLAIAMTQAAQAQCYNFLVGQEHPEQIVDVQLAAPAKQICIQDLTGPNGEKYNKITLSDDIGALVHFSATLKAQARCGLDCGEIYDLAQGTTGREMFDAQGITLEISTEYKSNIGVSLGTLKVSGGRSLPKNYLIMKKN